MQTTKALEGNILKKFIQGGRKWRQESGIGKNLLKKKITRIYYRVLNWSSIVELNPHVLSQCSFQSGIPQPAEPLSPGYFLEIQILNLYHRHTESETVVIIPSL